jgi:hypothetical protein
LGDSIIFPLAFFRDHQLSELVFLQKGIAKWKDFLSGGTDKKNCTHKKKFITLSRKHVYAILYGAILRSLKILNLLWGVFRHLLELSYQTFQHIAIFRIRRPTATNARDRIFPWATRFFLSLKNFPTSLCKSIPR